jgi:uncharacterized membrane protein YbhN (UPF0104 family)
VTAPKTRHPLVHRAIQVMRVAIVIAVVVAVAYSAANEWGAVSKTIRSLSWQSLVIAISAVVAGMFSTVKVWQHLLAALGTNLAYRRAVQINLVGQLGKYLPGSVWSFLLQVELGRRYQVPRARAMVTLILSAGLAIATALTVSVFAVEPLLGKWGNAAWLLALGPLALLMLVPRVLTWISNNLLRLMRRPKLDQPIVVRHLPWALGWSIFSWLLFGVSIWGLVSSLGELSFRNYLLVTGVFALAMAAGFVAFVLPSGVGVREAVIVAGLAPLLPTGPALAFALASRLIFTVADVSSALIAAFIARGVQTSGVSTAAEPVALEGSTIR